MPCAAFDRFALHCTGVFDRFALHCTGVSSGDRLLYFAVVAKGPRCSDVQSYNLIIDNDYFGLGKVSK